MSRHLGPAMLIAAGMVLGWALNCYERIHAAPPARADVVVEDQSGDVANQPQESSDVVDQLKEINTHLKKIDTLLHSGKLTVINAINADIAP